MNSLFNLSSEVLFALQEQIIREYSALYTYRSYGNYFAHHSVALPGFAALFTKQSKEEQEHAEKFIAYLTQRGGFMSINPIKNNFVKPSHVLDALKAALAQEQEVTQSIYTLRALAEKHHDIHLVAFLDGTFIPEQLEEEEKFRRLLTQVALVGDGLGIYLFDKSL